jgi:hypothetical protein
MENGAMCVAEGKNMAESGGGNDPVASFGPFIPAFSTDLTVWYEEDPQQIKSRYENDLFRFDWQCNPDTGDFPGSRENEIIRYRKSTIPWSDSSGFNQIA